MPHFIKCLGDVEEGSRAQVSPFETFNYLVGNPMCLVDGGVAGSESKLMIG